MFSDGDGEYAEGCLVQRDLQYVESLGDKASEFFLNLAPQVGQSARQLLNPDKMILSEAAYAKLGGLSFSILYCTWARLRCCWRIARHCTLACNF